MAKKKSVLTEDEMRLHTCTRCRQVKREKFMYLQTSKYKANVKNWRCKGRSVCVKIKMRRDRERAQASRLM